ncbi:hypothetical protein [Williamsia sp. R60]
MFEIVAAKHSLVCRRQLAKILNNVISERRWWTPSCHNGRMVLLVSVHGEDVSRIGAFDQPECGGGHCVQCFVPAEVLRNVLDEPVECHSVVRQYLEKRIIVHRYCGRPAVRRSA